MCVAIVKKQGVPLPSRKALYNCFISNPHGAGYMFVDNGKLHIKKGFMTFKSFYKSFMNEGFTEKDNLLIHFRIATHGLVDGGNCHPFPITSKITSMRKTDNLFEGYGLIHNGIFDYDKKFYKRFDPTNIASDTMLFSMVLNNYLKTQDENENIERVIDKLYTLYTGMEQAIAYAIQKDKESILHKYINDFLYGNKVAVMDDKGNIKKFGKWIEFQGCFYSNYSFEDYPYYGVLKKFKKYF
jgi:predicted glutamine amidotransferase